MGNFFGASMGEWNSVSAPSVVYIVEDDMADDSIGDWTQAGITATFDTDHYEITEMMAGQSFYQIGLNFIEGTVYEAQFDIKDGVGTGSETVSLDVGETFYGGQSLQQDVVTTSEWVTQGPFEFTALHDTVAMRFGFDLANTESVLLRNVWIRSKV